MDKKKPPSPPNPLGVSSIRFGTPILLNSAGEPLFEALSSLGSFGTINATGVVNSAFAFSESQGGSLAFQPLFNIEEHPKYKELAEETRVLRAKLLDKNNSAEEQRLQIEKLNRLNNLGFLLSRVNAQAVAKLLDSPEFAAKFLDSPIHESFVMSVDIRRSTELMLKARSAEQFASFISAYVGT